MEGRNSVVIDERVIMAVLVSLLRLRSSELSEAHPCIEPSRAGTDTFNFDPVGGSKGHESSISRYVMCASICLYYMYVIVADIRLHFIESPTGLYIYTHIGAT